MFRFKICTYIIYRMKVSDFIAKFLRDHEMNKVFSVTGGFAMHLNDSFGNEMDVSYLTNEINCGYAAIGWGKPCTVCVTAGCGATNAITPCLISWQDSVPVLFVSGAVKTTENTRTHHMRSRTYSGSDCDIITMVSGITKYSHEIENPQCILEVMERAFWNLTHGRKGPVWLSIPLDIQSMDVPEVLEYWIPPITKPFDIVPNTIFDESYKPLVIIGNGFHGSDISKITVPFVVTFFGSDIPGYVGKIGVIGDKNGNEAFGQADLVIALGCRLSKTVTGYKDDIIKDKRIIQVDIDTTEFHKPGIEYIYCDVESFINNVKWPSSNKWFKPEPQPRPDKDIDNPYTILDDFFNIKPENSTIVASSGSIFCAMWHAYICKKNDSIVFSGHGDMGFEIPASIGHAMRTGRRTFCIVGDGALQYSIPEFMNLKNLPVTVLCFNNGGYGAIQITQRQYFDSREYGTKFNFPSLKSIAEIYDIPYCTEYRDVESGPCIVELFVRVQPRMWRI
jgi:acetolactate synthase-1/2/3 large subunit